jgi:hypothetical protein
MMVGHHIGYREREGITLLRILSNLANPIILPYSNTTTFNSNLTNLEATLAIPNTLLYISAKTFKNYSTNLEPTTNPIPTLYSYTFRFYIRATSA